MNKAFENTKKRTPNQRETILAMLKEAGDKGILNTELVKFCIGYRTRISELYSMGYIIDCDYVTKGVARYTFQSEPEAELDYKQERAYDLLMKLIKENGGRVTRKRMAKILKENGLNITRKHGAFKGHAKATE